MSNYWATKKTFAAYFLKKSADTHDKSNLVLPSADVWSTMDSIRLVQ
jgi:hypothetical protein